MTTRYAVTEHHLASPFAVLVQPLGLTDALTRAEFDALIAPRYEDVEWHTEIEATAFLRAEGLVDLDARVAVVFELAEILDDLLAPHSVAPISEGCQR